MEDLISKQDAVNTSLEFFVEFLGGALHENVQKELITRFQRLPSAHPELDEWCTECKEYDHEKHNCPRYNRVIREAVEEMRRENQWTPCSKELPTEDGDWDIFDVSGKKYWFLIGCKEDLDDPGTDGCDGYEEWREE